MIQEQREDYETRINRVVELWMNGDMNDFEFASWMDSCSQRLMKDVNKKEPENA